MSWKLEEFSYAGHTVEIRFTPYNSKLTAKIKGPRASTMNRDIYANDIERKITSRIPFASASAKKVDDNVYDLYRKARNEIDNAIAAYAKKHEDEYQ